MSGIGLVLDWRKATNKLCKAFVNKFFGDNEFYDISFDNGYYFLYINNYWFNLTSIIDALANDITKEELIDYFNNVLNKGKSYISLMEYINYKRDKRKHLNLVWVNAGRIKR